MGETRNFRSQHSLNAEADRRNALAPFLENCGFSEIVDKRIRRGTAETQILTAQPPGGDPIRLRVRLCWRRGGRNASERLYSAAQLTAKLRNGDWDGTLEFLRQRDLEATITHTLFVQDQDGVVITAALVPRDALMPIWQRQRELSAELIRSNALGSIKGNHAMNGSSPTIWLQDDRRPNAHLVADVLWSWPGVTNLAALRSARAAAPINDSLADLSSETPPLGRDSGERALRTVSGYPRDPLVRAAVIERSGGSCERDGCRATRNFSGFLDVHHILGVGTSDRVWNCVALCPNCHREAHFSPDRDMLNEQLLRHVTTESG